MTKQQRNDLARLYAGNYGNTIAKTHTPGPWQTFTYPDHVAVVFCPTNPRRAGTVCDLTGVGGEHDANARLIAAAPELLDACKGLLDSLDAYPPQSHMLDKAAEILNRRIEFAKSAIAKATHE